MAALFFLLCVPQTSIPSACTCEFVYNIAEITKLDGLMDKVKYL